MESMMNRGMRETLHLREPLPPLRMVADLASKRRGTLLYSVDFAIILIVLCAFVVFNFKWASLKTYF